MKKCILTITVLLFAMSLFSADMGIKNKSGASFKLSVNKTAAIGMTAGGGGCLLLGIAFISSGASLINYFMVNVDEIAEYDGFGYPVKYYWSKDGLKNPHLLYYTPGVALAITGGIVSVVALGVMLGSIYFWLADGIKKNNSKKVGLFIEPGIDTKLGLALKF